ncbi:LPXTG cell wall anchor domain-containing protein, partial [Enterococcus faecalis]|nr:LPXTG cell wall anchor domain-containing protein [Enterococcus faecalis]
GGVKQVAKVTVKENKTSVEVKNSDSKMDTMNSSNSSSLVESDDKKMDTLSITNKMENKHLSKENSLPETGENPDIIITLIGMFLAILGFGLKRNFKKKN